MSVTAQSEVSIRTPPT